jgi:hypothetical protein
MLRTYAVAYMFFKKITDVKNWTDTDHEKYFICYKNKMWKFGFRFFSKQTQACKLYVKNLKCL